ncbi:Uncharacterised protein [Escherichia coli]|nr:Uncharacterised protein [Escherichia coli]
MMILVTGGRTEREESPRRGAYWGLFTGSVYRYLANP